MIASFKRLFSLFVVAFTLASCNSDGIGRYKVETIGSAQRSVAATVLSAKPVQIVRQNTGAGANAGAAMGGALAYDNSDSAAAIVAGVIAGAVIGDAIESSGNALNGKEYVIQTENELLLTVAQINQNNEIFGAGDKVILVYGHPHKLIRDPR